METEGAPEKPRLMHEIDYLGGWAGFCFSSFTLSLLLSPYIKSAVRAVLTDLAYPAGTISWAGAITGVTLSTVYECLFFCSVVPLILSRNGFKASRKELLKTAILISATSLLCMWYVSAPILDLVRRMHQSLWISAEQVHIRVLCVSLVLSVTYIYVAFRFFVSRMDVTKCRAVVKEEEYADVL